MRDLRDLSGYQRLKVNVVAAISEQLRSIGLDHLPPGSLATGTTEPARPGFQDRK